MYQVIKPKNSNSIIPELNATVLSATFKSKKGFRKQTYTPTKELFVGILMRW